jgi:hypothetical protein
LVKQPVPVNELTQQITGVTDQMLLEKGKHLSDAIIDVSEIIKITNK